MIRPTSLFRIDPVVSEKKSKM